MYTSGSSEVYSLRSVKTLIFVLKWQADHLITIEKPLFFPTVFEMSSLFSHILPLFAFIYFWTLYSGPFIFLLICIYIMLSYLLEISGD